MNLRLASGVGLALLALALTVFLGCATLSPQEREAKRIELDKMGEKALATLLETKPGLGEVFDKSIGYMVLDMTVTKIPMVGAGSGAGVVVDKRTNTRSYIKVTRFEVGGGLGAQKFKVIVFFNEGKLLDRVAAGAWHYDAGAEAAAGSMSIEGAVTTTFSKGYQAYKLSEGGAAATVTVRVAYSKPYLD
jgi:lipid-binding SYLF domain-containing protein